MFERDVVTRSCTFVAVKVAPVTSLFAMTSRTAGLVKLAKTQYAQKEINADFSISHLEATAEGDDSIVNISEDAALIDEVLTPEDIAHILNEAELVFADDLQSLCQFNTLKEPGNSKWDIVEEQFRGRESKQDVNGHVQENTDRDYFPPSDENSDPERGNTDTDYFPPSDDSDMEVEDDNSSRDNQIDLQDVTTVTNRTKVRGQRKREINQKLRLQGKQYLGYRKPKGQHNTFHDT